MPTSDGASLFEAFDPSRTNLSGEIATISLKVQVDQQEEEPKEKLELLLSDSALRDELLVAAKARIKKRIGTAYSLESFDVDLRTRTIRMKVGTLFETGSPEAIASDVASAVKGFSEDLQSALVDRVSAPVRIQAAWKPGKGLTVPLRLASMDTPAPALEEHRDFLRFRRDRIAGLQVILLLAGCGVLALLALLIMLAAHGGTMSIFLLYVALIAAVVVVMNRMLGSRVGELDNDIREVGNELDLLRIETDQGEARAQKLFQSHAFEIKRYYDQALRQGRSIYYVGIVCIGLGFGVIATAFVLVSNTKNSALSEQVIVGALGAIGAILANFIAVVYLRMFSETVQALTSFHQRLVTTHHLHFGNFLASKIKDQGTRETALAEMSKGLSVSARINLGDDPVVGSRNGSEAEKATS
jgi:hypothetical protein